MTEPRSPSKRAADSAEFAHGVLVSLVNAFPADQAAFQPSPTDNHLLWHLGHLAMDYRWFASAIDGKPPEIAEEEQRLFGMGSKPIPDASAYPSLEELRSRFEVGWQRLMTALGALREEDTIKPALAGSGDFLKDRLDTVDKVAWHDGWHAGQISGLRKALGLKGVL